MKKRYKVLVFLGLMMVCAFAFGPTPEFEQINPEKSSFDVPIDKIEAYMKENDAKVPDLKSGNESRLYWNDPEEKNKTEYAVLYLHGFSASGVEGEEVHIPFAKAIGANLYIPRLIDSGRKSIDTFKGMTPKDLLESAKEAIAVAKKLGDKLIVVSCSTGGTYSAYLAGYDDEIDVLVLLSPNFKLFDKRSELIMKPWGVKFLTYMQGSDYNVLTHYSEEKKKYWNAKYHLDGVVALQALLSEGMKKEHFEKITQPTFLMAYYENEIEQDSVVSVARMREFYDQISTLDSQKRFVECANCQNHVISSKLFNDNTNLVMEELLDFTKNVLKIPLVSEVVPDGELVH